MKATRKRRLCPTCGSSIDRGPGKHTYCSEACRPTCIHPTCNKPTRGADDVCASHQAQRRRHGELRPDRWAKEWICVVCGNDVEEGSGRRKYCSASCTQAHRAYNGNRPTKLTCILCEREFSTMRRDGRFQRTDTLFCRDCGRTSPEALRFRRYGVTIKQYADALAAGCQICGDIVKKLHIDHDHACCPADRHRTCGKCVRGFLCGPCNRALGMLRDDPTIIRKAIAYLER